MMFSTKGIRLRSRSCLLAAVATLFLLAASQAVAGEFSGIVFFGDSLSDAGNHFLAFGKVTQQPFPPYPDEPYALGGHHYSNGETWAEQFASGMKLPASGKPAFRSPGLFTNYAVGRARARAGAPVFSEFDLSTQIGLFLEDFGGLASPDKLYVIWIGVNDCNDALSALTGDPSGATSYAILQQALAAVAGNVQALWAAGARVFLVPDAVNVAITPLVRSLGPEAQGAATLLTNAYNDALGEALAALALLPGTRFVGLDVNAHLADWISDPLSVGLTNVEDPCLIFGVVGQAICSGPQRYLFWDAAHPTKAGHGLFAKEALIAIGWE
jgi:phospholipase/lecithinase/hemolysin